MAVLADLQALMFVQIQEATGFTAMTDSSSAIAVIQLILLERLM